MTKIRRRCLPWTTARYGFPLLLFLSGVSTIQALSSVKPAGSNNRRNAQYGGGRTAGKADMPNLPLNGDNDNESCANRWSPTPLKASEARLTICQVTDVYTLEHFASLKTMLQETRATLHQYHEEAAKKSASDTAGSKTKSSKPEYLTDCFDDNDGVISMLTGDFLAPYLLSSIDRGKGMMNAMVATPIDYVTWGNHEGTSRIVSNFFILF